MSEAYYRKWRPLGWESLIGQDHIVQTLKNAIIQDRIAHAYLFSGPRGTGKTSTARIIAKAVNCLADDKKDKPCNACEHCQAINAGRFLDLIEIDAASNTSVDDVRSLREKINYSPSQGEYKVYIIDEVHMLSNAAFNALLKTLEEPPQHAIFVLATTEVHKIPATVLSRCQRHEFRRIPLKTIQTQLAEIAEKEKITIEPSALTEIARQATGSMRDAVSLLDQLASTGDDVTLQFTKEVLGTAGNEFITHLIEAIVERNAGNAISIVNHTLDSGSDPRQFGRQVVNYLRNLLLVKMNNTESLETTQEEIDQLTMLSQKISLEMVLAAIDIFDRSTESNSIGWQPSLQLELAVLHACGSGRKEQAPQVSERQQKEKASPPAEVKVPKKPIEVPAAVETSADVEKFSKKEEKTPKETPKKTAQNIDVEQNGIETYWKEIKEIAKNISGETGALLNSCRSATIKKGIVVLEFSSSILQSKMENGNNLDNARRAIQELTGVAYNFRCEVTKTDNQQSKEDQTIDKDGMVGEALSLGGKMRKEDN
jgi:DNA polymerase III subunit gamma/tau